MEVTLEPCWTGREQSTAAGLILDYNPILRRSSPGFPRDRRFLIEWADKLKIGSTVIEDTFAEAFGMRYCRIIVTGHNRRWLEAAVHSFCGYGSSVIGCDAEVGAEQWLESSETPDGRIGVKILVFGFSSKAVQAALINRTGQCLMTCPTTAVFAGGKREEEDGVEPAERIPLGKHLRFFGDGYQKSKLIGDRRFWRIPVMDGEFLVEDAVEVRKGVAGGNLLILARDQNAGLASAERVVAALDILAEVITPFPGGVVRSGSKVGSRYPSLKASTADRYCPTLRGRVESDLPENVNCVYEIVVDGTSSEAVAEATRIGIEAAVGEGVVSISAGNYGGKLGKHHFYLHDIMSSR
jgi:formylmethanofuran--tetrahydromethanopterin N-formyltransferase